MPEPATPRSAHPARMRLARLATPAAVLGGGLAGSAARAAITSAIPSSSGAFPVATLIVNVAGSLLLGFYLARRQRSLAARRSVQFWAIGALGSFTTFSAFTFEAVRLADTGHFAVAAGYVAASLAGGLAAALFGHRAGSIVR